MSNTFDKLSVLASFIEEVNSYLPEIEVNLGRLAQTPGDMEALEETYRRTHTIGGSASMMDFPGLAHVGHGMEDILGDVLDGLATLDAPTIGLLQRSLERMRRLLAGIRSGIDEDAVIAEDDADYTQYRAGIESATRSELLTDETLQRINAMPTVNEAEEDQADSVYSVPFAVESTMPSFDEVLASFRTPSLDRDEEAVWPEEPSAFAPVQQEVEPESEPATEFQFEPQPVQASAWEKLTATAQQPVVYDTPSATPFLVDEEEEALVSQPADAESAPPVSQQQLLETFTPFEVPLELPGQSLFPVEIPTVASVLLPGTVLAKTYTTMQEEVHALEVQASSLKQTLSQMQLAVSVIEAQRSEFRTFLDGSKDALDRMEEWAGKAMGLNLRNSPERVRRYLPLSVMWVANNKLKKVLDLLVHTTGNVGATDEQIQTALQQLRSSIEACGETFKRLEASTASPLFAQDASWTPWEMQVSHEAEPMRERVTLERYGDPIALRAEIEAAVREELRQESARPLTLAARAELEQQIRNEVRQEFAAQRQLQEHVSGSGQDETFAEIEARLRNEIEIQVRSEFLSQLTGNDGDAAPVVSAQTQMFAAPLATSTVSSSTYSPATTPSLATDFGEEAAEIFCLEAEEHLQTISMYVSDLEKAPEDRNLIQGIRRATHTLKGAASMMGFRPIADLCHISEDLLDSVMEGAILVSSNILSLILDTAEVLELLINGKEQESAEGEKAVQALRVRYVALLGEQSTLIHDAEEEEEEFDPELAAGVAQGLSIAPVASVVADTQPTELRMRQDPRRDLSVRVPLQKLDELVNLFGELLVNRSTLAERLQRLMRLVADTSVSSARLRDVGQKLESRFEAATLPSGRSIQVLPGYGTQSNGSIPGGNGKNANARPGLSHLEEFDELELDRYTEFHQLARGLSEGISDMTTLSNEMETVIRECEGVFGRENRLSTTFQDRLMKARLVPLSTMISRLYRTTSAVALKQHKESTLVLEGQETEVDRTVIEEIAGPLLHLVRNAVNHAIETPEVRLGKGKPAAGQIKLSAAYEGNLVVITVRDDGTGIEPERVRQAAVARGLIRSDQPLSEGDLINLIFMPGFSTTDVLSEESGRGVGLDVVRDSVSRLRGTLEVESTPGQGTAFTMKFPTSLAIQSAMMVQVGEQQFAIPMVMVESIGRLDNYKQSTFDGHPAVLVQNELYTLVPLSHYLNLPTGQVAEKAPMLLVNTGRQKVALVVDGIKGKLEVVMKNLGPHLRHVHGIAGGTVLGNGHVVLILELIELLASPQSSMIRGVAGMVNAPTHASAGAPRRGASAPAAPAPPTGLSEGAKHVLIVDDSPSVRRVVGSMLKQHGWEVQLARDGVEALEMITRETPAAVLLDIEMPRMDGFELVATVRAQEQYRTLPMIILTSRAATKHQQRALQLGASDYLVKPYQDEQLINLLHTLVYGASVR